MLRSPCDRFNTSSRLESLEPEFGTLNGQSPRTESTNAVAIGANGALGPTVSAIVIGVGRGDLGCQRYLFQDRIDALLDPALVNEDAMLIAMEVVLFGRIIASHGNRSDIRRFAGALCAASSVFREGGREDLGNTLMAEALSVLEQLAEQGDDLAAVSSEALIKNEPAELIDWVRALRRRGTQNEETA
jgi:hypothetical protein